jgi:regulator of protease activity HflC (stomatin/prohibitin superfamily)
MIFDAILKKVTDSLSGMLIGSDLITTDALLAVHKFGDQKGKEENRPSKAEMFKKIKVAFMEEAGSRLLQEWGVEVRHLIVTEIKTRDPEVQKAMADGVRRNVEAAGMLESARIAVETACITALGEAEVARIKSESDAYRIRTIAQAQEDAGRMLERIPTAVTIRLAEAGADAISKVGSTIVVQDVGAQGLLALMGASKASTNKTLSVTENRD